MSGVDSPSPDASAPDRPSQPAPSPEVPTTSEAAKRGKGPLPARFLAELPPDPELARLARAFEDGNYAWVRRHAPLLAERTEDEAVRAAARDLLRRLEPDPLAKYLLALSVLLLIGVTIFVYAVQGSGG